GRRPSEDLRARSGRRRARPRDRSAAAPARAGGRRAREARAPSPAADAPRRHRPADAQRALPFLPSPARGYAGPAAPGASSPGRVETREEALAYLDSLSAEP